MRLSKAWIVVLALVSGCSDDSNNPLVDGPMQDLLPQFEGIVPTDMPPPPLDSMHLEGTTPGDGSSDGFIPAPAKCGGTATVSLQEVATGQPDYLSVKNTGGAAVNLTGFQLVMVGIDPVTYTFQTGTSIAAGKTTYVFEYSYGQAGDIMTGANIPFYDALDSNSVALYDSAGHLLDFVSVGDTVVGLPSGASATNIAWPASFDPDKQSFQRTGYVGKCPGFKATDWAPKAITRPPAP